MIPRRRYSPRRFITVSALVAEIFVGSRSARNHVHRAARAGSGAVINNTFTSVSHNVFLLHGLGFNGVFARRGRESGARKPPPRFRRLAPVNKVNASAEREKSGPLGPNGKLVLKRASQGRTNFQARPQLGFSLYEIQPNVRSASLPVELDCLERKERPGEGHGDGTLPMR